MLSLKPELRHFAYPSPNFHRGRNCEIFRFLWKFTSGQIQDGGRRSNCTYWNRNNFASDCSISLKFGTKFDQMTDTLQTFKVKGSKVKVTAWPTSNFII